MGNSLIAQYLIEDRMLTPKEAGLIARDSMNTGAGFSKIILCLGLFTEKQFLEYVQKKAHIATHKSDPWSYPENIKKKFPLELFADLEVLPEKMDDQYFYVMMPDPLDEGILEQLRFFTDRQIIGKVAPLSYILESLCHEVESFQVSPVTIRPNLLKSLLKNQLIYERFSQKQFIKGLTVDPYLSLYVPDSSDPESIEPLDSIQEKLTLPNPTELLSGKTKVSTWQAHKIKKDSIPLEHRKRTLTSFMGRRTQKTSPEQDQTLTELSKAISNLSFSTNKEESMKGVFACFEKIAITQFYYFRVEDQRIKILHTWPSFSSGPKRGPQFQSQLESLFAKQNFNQWLEVPKRKQDFLNWPSRKGYQVLGLHWEYLLHTNYCFVQWKGSFIEKSTASMVKQLLKSISTYD